MDEYWMDDNWQLFESLRQASEFTVTEEHLKLLRHVWVDSWELGEGFGDGAPSISPKKPYGNSNVPRHVAEILDAPDEDWVYEDGEKVDVTEEAAARFTRLHVETMFALQIVLVAGEFRPGRYRRDNIWGIHWRRDDSGQ